MRGICRSRIQCFLTNEDAIDPMAGWVFRFEVKFHATHPLNVAAHLIVRVSSERSLKILFEHVADLCTVSSTTET